MPTNIQRRLIRKLYKNNYNDMMMDIFHVCCSIGVYHSADDLDP